MKRTLAALAALPLLVSLAACGGDDEPAAEKTVTVSATPTPTPTLTPTPSPSASVGSEPNVGESALRVGQWREGSQLRTRVLKVNQAGEGGMPDYLSGDDEAHGVTVLVRSCNRKTVTDETLVAMYDWTASDDRGGIYEAGGTSWEVWPPLPQYPAERTIRPGACVEGWVLIPVPERVKVTSVALGDGQGGSAAEWKVK